jgi:cobalt/nickel transport system permease protein
VHHVVLDRWSRGQSPLHNRDARVKLIALLAFLVALATTRNGTPWIAASYAAILLTGILVARLPLFAVLYRATFVLPFSATFAIVSWLSGDLQRAAALLLKSYLSALAVLLLLATTALPELMRALETLHVPRVLALVVQFLYRYLFLISGEAQHMLLAARCRAPLPARRQSLQTRFQSAAGALGVLFARSFTRAEGIQNAMAARGFSGHFPALRARKATWMDAFFLVGILCLILALRLGAKP